MRLAHCVNPTKAKLPSYPPQSCQSWTGVVRSPMVLPPPTYIPVMPSLPFHPCANPLCPTLVRIGRYCDQCARLPANARTKPRTLRPYDKAQHRRWRLLVLARDPVCRACKRELSTDADHIVPLDQGGTWAMDNGQGLCPRCHGQKTRREHSTTNTAGSAGKAESEY